MEEKVYFERDLGEISQPLTRKRSSSIHSQEMQSSQGTPNDLPREAQSAPYENARYESILATRDAFMDESDIGVSKDCEALFKKSLSNTQELPSHTPFRDDYFKRIHQKLRNENEAMVIRDITRLIVPSAKNCAIYEGRASNLKILKEKVNSSWLKCIPLSKPSPQPDYSVGFKASAFTKDQLNRLSPFVGEYMELCSVMAREDVYFPVLSSEGKCGDQGLKVADRQNMRSASVAVKGIVDLFRRVDRQKELHCTILAFRFLTTMRLCGSMAIMVYLMEMMHASTAIPSRNSTSLVRKGKRNGQPTVYQECLRHFCSNPPQKD